MHEKVEGVTLLAKSFGENNKIISVFTKEKGLISLMIKRLSQKKSSLFALASPFCVGEFVYKVGKGDIYTILDAAILKENFELRSSFETIECAAKMTRAILNSQMPHKSAPAVYMLLKAYLGNLWQFERPQTLLASFYLKILLHEGLLDPQIIDETMNELAFARSFSKLKELSINKEQEKITADLFCQLIG